MYKLKQIPKDFIVNEIYDYNLKKEKSAYAYFKIKKRNYNTMDAISQICRITKINPNAIRFSGNKDRNAITTQAISAETRFENNIKNLRLKDIQIEFIGYSDKPISMGSHKGNQFEITIRNLTKK